MANHTAFFFDQTNGRPARAMGGTEYIGDKEHGLSITRVSSVILSQEDDNRRWGTLLSIPIPDAIALAKWILREYDKAEVSNG